MSNKSKNDIQKLLNAQLSEQEEKVLINEIKNNAELKMEFALQSRLYKNAKQQMKNELKERFKTLQETTIAAEQLEQIRKAAFGKTDTYGEDLPVSDETIQNFLDENEEEEDD